MKHIREDRPLAAKITGYSDPEISSYRRAARRRGRSPFHGPLAGACRVVCFLLSRREKAQKSLD